MVKRCNRNVYFILILYQVYFNGNYIRRERNDTAHVTSLFLCFLLYYGVTKYLSHSVRIQLVFGLQVVPCACTVSFKVETGSGTFVPD